MRMIYTYRFFWHTFPFNRCTPFQLKSCTPFPLNRCTHTTYVVIMCKSVLLQICRRMMTNIRNLEIMFFLQICTRTMTRIRNAEIRRGIPAKRPIAWCTKTMTFLSWRWKKRKKSLTLLKRYDIRFKYKAQGFARDNRKYLKHLVEIEPTTSDYMSTALPLSDRGFLLFFITQHMRHYMPGFLDPLLIACLS